MSESALGKATGSSDADDKESSVPVYQRKEWLQRHYWGKEMSTYEMADKAGTCRQTISNWMERHDVDKRNPRHKRDHIVQSNATERISDKDWLQQKYHQEGLSTVEIGDLVGVTPEAVLRWMGKFGIETRDKADYVLRGEDHPDWQGGYEQYYGPNWPQQRQKAVERDSHECRRCGISERESIDTHGRKLDVHHIEPFRKFDSPEAANRLDNLLTLCRTCHRRLEGLPIDTR